MSDLTATTPASPAAGGATTTAGWAWPAALAVVVAALAATYARELGDLLDTWTEDPDYSHGYLVVPVAAWVLHRRWPGAAAATSRPSAWGWALAAASLAARSYWHESGRPWLEQVTLLPTVFGLALALGGWRLLRWAWPGLAYLAFMFPLPGWVNQAVSVPLQDLATYLTTHLLRLTGLWVMAEGSVIHVGSHPLEVARACSGLKMLMSLAATVVALVTLVPMATWRRLVLLATIVPVAIVSNVLRITGTAWCYHLFGAEVGDKYAHDGAGLLMMPTALALVALEMVALSWLVTEREVEADARPLDDLGLYPTARTS